MKMIQLFMMALAVCSETYGKEFYFEGCRSSDVVDNTAITCHYGTGCRHNNNCNGGQETGCRITCNGGQEFSDGATHLDVQCHHGQWKYRGSTIIPKCKDHCQIASVLADRSWYSCDYPIGDLTCNTRCRGERDVTHTCNQVTGVWSPPIRKCRPNNVKCSTCEQSKGTWSPPVTIFRTRKPEKLPWDDCKISGGQLTRQGMISGSNMTCSYTMGCVVNCLSGYTLSIGGSEVTAQCSRGRWTYPGWSHQPKCLPICSPSCQNGGKCLNPGQCHCTNEFTGPRCQYPYSNCHMGSSVYNGIISRCEWNSDEKTCFLRCSHRDYAVTHTCDYATRRWSPPIKQCIKNKDSCTYCNQGRKQDLVLGVAVKSKVPI